MELSHYTHLFRRWLWLLVACPLVAGAVAAGVSLSLPKVYESHEQLLVRPAQPLTVDTGGAALTSDQIVATYAQLMLEPPMLNQVISELGLKIPYDQLARQITITPKPGTTILDVAVQDTDPALAQAIDSRLVDDFITQIKLIQKQETSQAPNARTQDNLIVVSPATLPTSPVSPSIIRNTLLAVLGGLMAGVGLVAGIDYLDRSIKTDRQLLELGLVPMAHIPFTPAPQRKRGEILTLAVSQPAAEAYRALRTSLLFSRVDNEIQTIVITSSLPGEGKSRTSANLAVVLAQAGHKTLLIDADFRRPSQHKLFGRVTNLGMTNMILRDRPESELILPIEDIPNLWLVTSGTRPHNPSELLGSGRTKELIAQFRQAFSFVVFDTPPVNAVTDAQVLAAESDATILVVEQNRATVPAVKHAAHALEVVGARVVGVVLNKLKEGGEEYYYGQRYDAVDQTAAQVIKTTPGARQDPAIAPRRAESGPAGTYQQS